MFVPMAGLTQREKADSRTRRFTGDGTPYLPVPGLVSVERVRVGATEVPLIGSWDVPLDRDCKRVAVANDPLIALEHDDQGVPVLLRSIRSNDGIWQAVPIFVTGEWEDAPEAPADRTARRTAAKQPAAA